MRKSRSSRSSRRSSRKGAARRHGNAVPPVHLLAERSFTPTTTWSVSRHFRPNGTGFWQLTEVSGRPFTRERTDWPVIYEDGNVVYDRPEQIPVRVREWCRRVLLPYRRLAPSALAVATAQAANAYGARPH